MNSFSGFIQKNKIIILVICLSFLLTNRNGSILIGFSCVGLAISFFPPSAVGTLVLYLPSDASHIPQKLFCRFNIFSRFVICSNCSDTSSEVIIFSLRSLSNDIMAGMASDFKEHNAKDIGKIFLFRHYLSLFCHFFLYSASIFLPATLLFLHTQPSTAYCVDSQSGLIQYS